MADQTVVQMGENSPEYVADRLMKDIAATENRSLSRNPSAGMQAADRAWVLDTYAECLEAVNGYRSVQKR